MAIADVFGTALAGNSKERPELVDVAMPFHVTFSALPCRGGEAFLRSLFEPLGYRVKTTRLFIQCAEALKNKTLKRGEENKIKIALHTCKEDLRNCEKAFARISHENNRIEESIRSAGGVKVEKGVVNNLPQIPNLEHDATIFLTSAKRALQSIADFLNAFYGISISNARFDKGISQLEKLNPKPVYLLEFFGRCNAIITRVLDLRNFQEHTPKKTVVKNFHVTVSGLFPPSWQIVPDPEKPMLPEMHEIIGSLIELAEISFFHALLDNLDGPFANAYVVEEIPSAQRENGSAVRFRCELKFVQSKSEGTSDI